MQRDALIKQLERLGARITGSVSKRTDLLLVGTAPGDNKITKARQHGVPMLSLLMADYLGLLDEHKGPAGLRRLDPDMLTTLSIYIAIYTEELYGHARMGSDRTFISFLRARDATRLLLHLAWGAELEGDIHDGSADPSDPA